MRGGTSLSINLFYRIFNRGDEMYYVQHYVIDWEKVQSLDDMKRLLAAMQIAFEPDHKSIESIKDLLRLEPKGSQIATMD